MRRTALLLTWAESPSPNVDEPPSAYATVTHQDGFKHVRFSGGTAREPDAVAGQVRTILERRERALSALGGRLDDVVVSRYYVLADHLTRETQARVHEVRDELFDRPNVPASTMIGVAALFDDALVEVELEAEVPDDRWETDVLTEGDTLA
jgi:enamine deaminase RidA (YjgF/YER057c/UK114 family)